jgi:hypothetical protein
MRKMVDGGKKEESNEKMVRKKISREKYSAV